MERRAMWWWGSACIEMMAGVQLGWCTSAGLHVLCCQQNMMSNITRAETEGCGALGASSSTALTIQVLHLGAVLGHTSLASPAAG